MSEYSLELPFKIKLVNPVEDIDADYGYYDSVEAANTAITQNMRKIAKTVLIKNTYTREVPVLDENGEPVLDENDVQVTETETKDVYDEFWWKDGLADENLIRKAPTLNAVLENGKTIQGNKGVVFVGNEDANLPEDWFTDGVKSKLWTGEDGTNVIFSTLDEINPDVFFYGNVALGIRTLENIESGWGNSIVGVVAAKRAKYAAMLTALGFGTFLTFEGKDLSHYRSMSAPYGKGTPNIAIGYRAGNGLKEGWGNVYIGDVLNNRPAVEFNQLAIGSSWDVGSGSETPTSSNYALIRGDFRRRWFQIAGKFRLNNHQNAPITDFSEANELAVFSSKPQPKTEYIEKKIQATDENGNPVFEEDGVTPVMVTETLEDGTPRYVGEETTTTHSKQMEIVDAKEYILQQIEGMDAAQIARLKTKLGI